MEVDGPVVAGVIIESEKFLVPIEYTVHLMATSRVNDCLIRLFRLG